MGDDEFLTRMCAIDPRYGTQEHQRKFCERMAEMQRRAPCVQKHEHNGGCYPAALLKEVCK